MNITGFGSTRALSTSCPSSAPSGKISWIYINARIAPMVWGFWGHSSPDLDARCRRCWVSAIATACDLECPWVGSTAQQVARGRCPQNVHEFVLSACVARSLSWGLGVRSGCWNGRWDDMEMVRCVSRAMEAAHSHRSHFGSRYTLGCCADAGHRRLPPCKDLSRTPGHTPNKAQDGCTPTRQIMLCTSLLCHVLFAWAFPAHLLIGSRAATKQRSPMLSTECCLAR